MKNIIKLLFCILVILFLSLYFSKYNNTYYENKSILTEEAIERFEKDLKEGKEITAKNYITEEKDYNNKISKIGIKSSLLIEKAFNKSLRYIAKYISTLADK